MICGTTNHRCFVIALLFAMLNASVCVLEIASLRLSQAHSN